MMSCSTGRPRARGHLAARLALVVVTTLLALLAGEGGLRIADGYVLLAVRLQPRHAASVPDWAGGGTGFARYDLQSFVEQWAFADDVDPGWLQQSPAQEVAYPPRPEHLQRLQEQHWMTNYVWNELYLQQLAGDGRTAREGPFLFAVDGLWTYSPPWQTPYPRFRYPSNCTIPPHLTTNQWGWRGPPIRRERDPGVVRIACVGASTTAGNPLSVSYPELLQRWLDTWSHDNGHGVRFEVINAGREALTSADLAAVVRHELLPMDLDYVIYYEGANELRLDTVVQLAADASYTPPTAGQAPQPGALRQRAERAASRSAWVRHGVAAADRWGWWPEPAKPEQTFYIHRGLDELDPDLDKLTGVMGLEDIVHNLDRIHADLTAQDVSMVMTTFAWLVEDGLALNPTRHGRIYVDLNREPFSYASIRRAVDLQNRVYRRWAEDHGVELVDLAALMPAEPDLYGDGIHANELGIRVRAWILLESLLPRISEDLDAGRIPRAPAVAPALEFPPTEYTDVSAFPVSLLPPG